MLIRIVLPLPSRHAEGYLHGVLHTPDGKKTPLPMQAREEALTMLAMAPVGAWYTVLEEEYEEAVERFTRYRKIDRNLWVQVL